MSNCKYFVNGDWVTENQLKELLNNGLLDNLVSNGTVAVKGFKVDNSKLLKAETIKVTTNNIPAVTLANILANEVKSRQGYTLNMLSALELTTPTEEERANGIEPDFKIPLWASPYASKFESLLTSLVSNKIVKQKFPGGSYILGSEEGFRIKEGDEAAGELKDSKIVFTSNFDPKEGLQPMRWDFENKKILPAQIMIPFKFRDESGEILSLKEFTVRGEDGRMMLDTTKIPDKLLQLFGFRIPTQERNSMAAVEIVGFLPEASGDLILAPRDFTKQMGSDFDVDKLYTYMYNHFYDNKTGKLHTNFVSDKKKIKSFIEITKQSIEDLKEEFKLSKEEKKILNAYIQEATASLSDQDYSERRSKGEETESELSKMAAEILNFSIKGELKEKLDYNINQLSILSRSYKASRQNNILDIHHRIMTSSNPEIISSIMALDSFGEFEKLAKDINTLRNADGAVPIILSDTYQRTKYINATAGKNGVGSFSLDSTFNATAQGKELTLQNLSAENRELLFGTVQDPRIPTAAEILAANEPIATFGEVVSKGDLSNKYTLRSQEIINRAKAEKRELTDKERESLKYKSTIIRALQSTAVDNEKAQILDKLNINDETFDAIRAMALLGFEEAEIVGLITQDIIWEFIDKLKDARSSLTSYNPNASADIFQELITKYDPSKSYTTLTPERIDTLASKSGVELISNIGNKTLVPMEKGTTPDFHLEQLALLDKFLKLTDTGKDIKVLQSTINTESSGIPKSLLETKTKVEQIERLPYLNIFNADRLLGGYEAGVLDNPTTINGYAAYYGAMFANKIYDKYFPYKVAGFNSVVAEIMTHTPKGDTISLAKKTTLQQEIFDQVRSYLYANTNTNLFGDNPDLERRRLFIDTKKNKSLASILNELSTTSWFQKNGFLNKLSFDINKNGTISRVNFEAAAGENLDERNIYDGFNYLLSKNFAIGNYNDIDYTSRILAQELVAAAFLEGGTQGAKQYLKYVPVAYLKSLGFGEYLQGIPFDFHETFFGNTTERGLIYNQPSTFTRQYFQNNPDQAKTISLSDLEKSDGKIPDFFTLNKAALADNFVDTIDPATGDPTKEQVHFLSIYDSKLPSNYALYEFDSASRVYRKISVLSGSYGFVGYNSQSKNSMPTEIQNLSTAAPVEQGAPGYTISNIPVTPSKKFDPNVVNNTTAPKTVEDLRIKKSLSGTKEALDDLLNNLETSNEVSTLNTQLIQLIRTLELPKNFKLVYDDTIESRAFYDSTESIQTLVLNLKIGRDRSVNKLATTVVHELIHTFTSASIKAYEAGELDTLSPKTIAVIQQLKSLQQLYKDELIAKEGPEGLKIFEKQYLDWKAKKADAPKVSAEEISKYYGAIKLEEFVTMALTDEGFQKHLNDITDETGISIWEQLKELLSNLLNALGLDIKPGSALATAIKDSMDLIKANQETLRENNITTAEFIEFGTRYKFEVDGNGKVVKAEYAQGNGVFKAMNAKTQQDKYNALKNKPGVQGKPTAQPTVKPAKIVKEGVTQLFKSNPKLAEVGTPEQYSEYLNTIFPLSKVRDIVYHRTASPTTIEKLKPQNDRIYFSDNTTAARYASWDQDNRNQFEPGAETKLQVIPAIVNLTNPVMLSGVNFKETETNKQGDGIIGTNIEDPLGGRENQIVVREAEQVHQLGTQQDIEQFKNFVSTQPFNKSSEVNIEVVSRYTDAEVKANPNKIYVFGDNTQRKGTGGQAQIRNNENAFGIATKFKPSTDNEAYFYDSEEEIAQQYIDADIAKIKADGRPIVFPKDGLGTGLAKLKEKAPQTYAYLKQRLLEEFGFDNDKGSLTNQRVQVKESNKYELFPGVFANAGQTEAIDKLNDFLKSDEKAFLLEGKGGTGKTTIIKQVIASSAGSGKKVLAIAPSHKAKKVLARSLKDLDVTVKTLASALAIKLDESTGKFEPDEYARKKGNVPIGNGQIIVIDESSMVSDALLAEIKQWVSSGAKVIFMGDRAQLPPVGQEKDSDVFGLKNRYELTEKMRQAATSPIINIGSKVAANAENDFNRVANPITPADRVNSTDAVSGSSITWEGSESAALDQFVEDLQKAEGDVNFAKIVTFNNQNHKSPQSVKNLNTKVRLKLFGERALEERFIPGEILTAYDSYNPTQGKEELDIVFYNSEDMIVEAVEFVPNRPVTVEVFSGAKGRRQASFNFDVEMLTLQNDEGKTITKFGRTVEIPVIAESSKVEYSAVLNKLWATDRQMAYALQAKFGNLEYGYAITSHKAQGSTYTNVYVMEDNIMGPSNGGSNKAKNQSLYVAVSRPTTKLVMVSGKNDATTIKRTGLDLSKLSGNLEDYQTLPTSSYGEENDRMNNRPSDDDYEAYQRMMSNELLMESPINSDNLRNYLLICGK